MNPDEPMKGPDGPNGPMNPREETEVRLTALIMGELPPEEIEKLAAQIAADPELAMLHRRLRRAAELVREASALPEEPKPEEPVQFSAEKRARLLRQFGQPKAPQMKVVKLPPRRDWSWLWSTSIAAALVAFLGGAVLTHRMVWVSEYAATPDFYAESSGLIDVTVPAASQSPAEAAPDSPRVYAPVPRTMTVDLGSATASVGSGSVVLPALPPPASAPTDPSQPTLSAIVTLKAKESAEQGARFKYGYVAENAPAPAALGDVPAAGGLVKTGSGTIQLGNVDVTKSGSGQWGAANTYSGGTTINGGTLALNGTATAGQEGKAKVAPQLGVVGGIFLPQSGGAQSNVSSLEKETWTENAAGEKTWAAQPGMIRIDGTGNAAGTLTLSGNNTITGTTVLGRADGSAVGNLADRGQLGQQPQFRGSFGDQNAPVVVPGAKASAPAQDFETGMGVRGNGPSNFEGRVNYGQSIASTKENAGQANTFGGGGGGGIALPQSSPSISVTAGTVVLNGTSGEVNGRGNVGQAENAPLGLPAGSASPSGTDGGKQRIGTGNLAPADQMRNGVSTGKDLAEKKQAGRGWAFDDSTPRIAGEKTVASGGNGTVASATGGFDNRAGVALPSSSPPAPREPDDSIAMLKMQVLEPEERMKMVDREAQSAPAASPGKGTKVDADRAPDLNLFGRPRVTEWPTADGSGAEAKVAGDGLPAPADNMASAMKSGSRSDQAVAPAKPASAPAPAAAVAGPVAARDSRREEESEQLQAMQEEMKAIRPPIARGQLAADGSLEVRDGDADGPQPAAAAKQEATAPTKPTSKIAPTPRKKAKESDTLKRDATPRKRAATPLAKAPSQNESQPTGDGEKTAQLGVERGQALLPKTERLFKSVDELRYAEKPADAKPAPAPAPKPEAAASSSATAVEPHAISEPSSTAGLVKAEGLEKAMRQTLAMEDRKKVVAEPEAEKPRPAPAPAPEPQPEIATSANAFSTFSLNVSDVSFKLAGAGLEQGRMPEPATIRSEEFLNAFDYRDPEPAPGAPLAFAAERARYPFAQNRDLLRLSVKTAAAGRQPGRALNLVLLVDNSGSMERADRVVILREALRVLSAQLQPQDKLSVVTFARTPRLWADGVAGNQAAEATARVSEITPQGGTNLAEALELGYATARKHYQVGSINRVVLLTDGAANLGNVDPETLKKKVETNRQQGIALDCFGIGWEGYDDTVLEALSRNGDGRYGFINSVEEAAGEFAGQLAGALRVAASDVKVQVEFNPNRVTAYRQIGYAKHQLKKEQFRDNTVDAAEIGAAEAGNALYVVEVNPRGSGDLATVRVRFKVPGTADYREHEWSVPFQAPAGALEQASPALKLAASASAFSEWLANSPYAAEVTTDRLLGLMNGVPAVYGGDPRPRKLELMIRAAKSITGR